ncbi:MAG: ribonuclease HI family protein [bacterium]|nr:ribonuclease HI family protein [bacterium]
MKRVTIFCDGGSRGNPGPAGIGYTMTFDDGTKIAEGKTIGAATNNVAEYQALLTALLRLKKEMQRRQVLEDIIIVVYLDSELVVRQLQGTYRVKSGLLRPLFSKILMIARSFPHISYVHIPRLKNKEADALVNRALDAELFP